MKTISLFLRDKIVIKDDEPKLDVRAVAWVTVLNLIVIAILVFLP